MPVLMQTKHCFPLAMGLLLGAALDASPVLAQSRVSGIVLDGRTAKPIGDARVRITGLDWEQVTDAQGRFVFSTLEANVVVLATEHVAFAPRTDTVRLTSAEHARLEIRLMGSVIELQPLTVETRSRRLEETGFFARQARGVGLFLTRTEIQAQRTQHLGDVLARLPGVRRVPTGDGAARMDTRGGKTLVARCDMQYFLDGAPMELGHAGLDGIPVHVVEAIEVYRGASEVPTQFDRGRAMCGAVMIWTRGG